ncbi:MAG: hypothetical protein JXA82_03320 [Sedimentisphaerales bacterium]|nr:hypothetical protein [Sedimentisphaerales bacterium]
MKIAYKNPKLERLAVVANMIIGLVIVTTFILLYGFDEIPFQLSTRTLHIFQIIAFLLLLTDKTGRFMNAVSKKAFLRAFWYEIPLLLLLMAVVFGANRWFSVDKPGRVIMFALAVYLVLQVGLRLGRICVNMAASGQNPAQSLIFSFLALIIAGAGVLMLPRAHNLDQMSPIDALFTATSATCVTGLIVKDTGTDFSLGGQITILTLIQFGGLGIVVFGAVIALLLGQALSVRESVAMQDLLSTQTLGRIGRIIGFIFITTLVIEAIGAILMVGMWKEIPTPMTEAHQQWFSSIFHSISAFCNAGFSLFGRSLMDYSDSWRVYIVICPLIILGGLGFGVLYNLFDVAVDKIRRKLHARHRPLGGYETTSPRKIHLQSKIVLTSSLVLILFGALVLWLFESYMASYPGHRGVGTVVFQSVTARTAGFNTIDIVAMSEASKLTLIVLMFIGGSPGSTAGGIKTVTLVVILMTSYASLRKRPHVEMFKRSIPLMVVGRAVTVAVLFAGVLLCITLALCVTEHENGFRLMDILFEATSALGTVGLTTGITGSLTTMGKLVIIAAMLIGRLGPLTLLATLTYNIKPAVYEYPAEPLIVG